MIKYKDYVAGWLDSSIHDVLAEMPRDAGSMKFALVTSIDSNVAPYTLLGKSRELSALAAVARALGSGLLLPTKALLAADCSQRIFFGFDEVWFFPSDEIDPKPESAWLVGPARIDQTKFDRLGIWLSKNACSLALGDGAGLNYIVKARGLVKRLLGHSITQPQPSETFVTSHPADRAG